MEKAGLAGSMPAIVACGSRGDAYDSFSTAHTQKDSEALLLVDAEGPMVSPNPWQHVEAQDGWNRPPSAKDAQCHIMVQVMESWFLADVGALESFYGQGFQSGALPPNREIEKVAKDDVLAGLTRAARNTKKGGYKKGMDSFDVLATLDPAKVMAASPWAGRLVDALSG